MTGGPERGDGASDATEATRVPSTPGAEGLRLVVMTPDGQTTTVELPKAAQVTIGRSRECEVRVDDPSVSRRHATVHLSPSLAVEDLGSANGTRVGGRALAPNARQAVEPGTLIEVGEVRVVIAGHRRRTREEEPPMARTRRLVETVAKGTISVLLLGETGTGKEVIARAIHGSSPRAAGPFVGINCAALPENLLESELFGYEKGAFTGANAPKLGLLESATAGTVLLDEIGEMPLATQAKLLRVLETRQVTPLGSVRPRAVDVRFVSATNRDLDALVRAGKFRDDLLFRIAGMTISVPPLRKRQDEIPELAARLLAEECERASVAKKRLSEAAVHLLVAYGWPGNLRELRSAMERAVLLTPGDVVDAPQVVLERHRIVPASERDVSAAPPSGSEPQAEGDSERDRIVRALEKCGGNQKAAAEMLGITRRALMYRMDRLGLKRPRKRG